MNENIQNKISPAKDIALSAEEKAEMKEILLAHIRTAKGETQMNAKHKNTIFIFSVLKMLQRPAFAGSAMAAILLSGVISAAAEGALPGELLYPVKTGINEKILGAASFSPELKAKWETRKLERRLEEAEKLAEKKEFSEEARTEIEEKLLEHAELAEKNIKAVDSLGDAETATNLSSGLEHSLDTHEKILEKFGEAEIEKFLPKLKEKKDSARNLKEKTELRLRETEPREKYEKQENDESAKSRGTPEKSKEEAEKEPEEKEDIRSF